MPDEALCFKRALAYQKPYCFLMNTHFPDFTLDLIERYMKRSLFFGCFPGMFSENASTNHFFANPVWYNASRPLFKKYIPLIQRIAQAGWEPITYARTSVPEVYVERYGRKSSTELFFTLLNDSADKREFTLEIDAEELGLTKNNSAKELISGRNITFSRTGGKLTARLTLESEDALLIAFEK